MIFGNSFNLLCHPIDGVPPELHQKVQSPSVSAEQNTRHVMLDSDAAEAMLDHLEKHEYASRRHVTLSLLWHTMMIVICIEQRHERVRVDEQRLGVCHASFPYSISSTCSERVSSPEANDGRFVKIGSSGLTGSGSATSSRQ